MRNAY